MLLGTNINTPHWVCFRLRVGNVFLLQESILTSRHVDPLKMSAQYSFEFAIMFSIFFF